MFKLRLFGVAPQNPFWVLRRNKKVFLREMLPVPARVVLMECYSSRVAKQDRSFTKENDENSIFSSTEQFLSHVSPQSRHE